MQDISLYIILCGFVIESIEWSLVFCIKKLSHHSVCNQTP